MPATLIAHFRTSHWVRFPPKAISGPSHSALPAFRWTTEVDGAKSELFQGWPHLGLPDVWDFDFVQMTPKEESPASSKLSDC
ncbi:Putative phospholipase B-like 2 [Durusdinium trenchii]|uniref:Phospholipase B-like 2 n=1 Tax=Durusdinium trenchii TaxID=1381693 RepID=A0ABP0HF86_9DINO